MIGFTDAVDLRPDGIGIAGDDKFRITRRGRKKIFQARYHNRYRAPGGLIFIVRLIDDLLVFIVDGRTANIQKVVFQINAAPFQTHDFRAPEGVKTEKGGDFARCAFDCGKKRLDLFRLQERVFLLRKFWEIHGEGFPRLMLHGGGDERPGVFYGLRGHGFQIDSTLADGVCEA